MQSACESALLDAAQQVITASHQLSHCLMHFSTSSDDESNCERLRSMLVDEMFGHRADKHRADWRQHGLSTHLHAGKHLWALRLLDASAHAPPPALLRSPNLLAYGLRECNKSHARFSGAQAPTTNASTRSCRRTRATPTPNTVGCSRWTSNSLSISEITSAHVLW